MAEPTQAAELVRHHCGCGHPFGDHEPCRTDGCDCPGYQPCDVCDPPLIDGGDA